MKKLNEIKEEAKKVAAKGKKVWDENKGFIIFMSGAVAYAVVDRAVYKFRIGGKDQRNRFLVENSVRPGETFIREKETRYDRFGIPMHTTYSAYNEEQVVNAINVLSDGLVALRANKEKPED